MAAYEYRYIVPSIEELEVNDSVQCSYEGCSKVCKSTASLSMHIIRHHEGKTMASTPHHDNRLSNILYYCPVSDCNRSKERGKRPFKKLGQVKQHYNLTHKEKRYVCEKCQKKFSMKDAFRRHLKECGNIFTCQKCSVELKSYNALYQHCKRSGHPLKDRRVKDQQAPVIIAPLIIKAVLPLPSTNTNATNSPTSSVDDEPVVTSCSVELATQTDDYISQCEQYLTTTQSSTLLQDNKITQTHSLAQCEFGTQTMPFLSDYSWPKLHPYTNDIDEILETIDFGTQTTEDNRIVFDATLDHHKDQSSQT